MRNKTLIAFGLVFLVLLIDQASKIYVKTHFLLGEEVKIFGFERALIHFVENPGMAFGMEFGGNYGKLALSLFRIVAVVLLTYYIRVLVKSDQKIGLISSFSLILAGALGNILDSAFYGKMFSESVPFFHGGEVARLFPAEGGYASFLHGKVVDMFYFPLFEGIFPAWLPIIGGDSYQFFRPVFNVADASITIGVATLLIFQRSFFVEEEKSKITENHQSNILSEEEVSSIENSAAETN